MGSPDFLQMSTFCFYSHIKMYYLRKKPMCRIHGSCEKWQNTHPWTFIVQPVIPKEMAVLVLPVFQATGSMREPWGKWAGWWLAAVQKWRRKKSCLFLTCAMAVTTYSYHITVSLTPHPLFRHRQQAWNPTLWVTSPKSSHLNKNQSLNLH